MFDDILVMKMGTLKEIVPSRKRDHAHVVEDNEPTNKRFRREKDDSNEEHALILALMGTISHGINDCIVIVGHPNT